MRMRGENVVTMVSGLEAIKYVFFICMYKKSEDSEKAPKLNTQYGKNDRTYQYPPDGGGNRYPHGRNQRTIWSRIGSSRRFAIHVCQFYI